MMQIQVQGTWRLVLAGMVVTVGLGLMVVTYVSPAVGAVIGVGLSLLPMLFALLRRPRPRPKSASACGCTRPVDP
ncbi:hypothetical protein [Streptodolium elevatio]|uniref:Uncharacterized protein n=1 Tax=Streptodolium elevatio TaxID=3157996 RepID=A0ABV3DWX0_9ACTN